MKHWISLLLLAAVALSGPAGAEAYKCRTADGRMEITNVHCSSRANTVKTVREEPVSEASRQQAEREVARMRDFVDKREAAQAAELERERQASQRQSATVSEGNGRSVDDCLRDLDQQALQPAQRAQKEAACRGNPQQPLYVPVPVPVYDDNPVANCIANAQRQNLSASERQRRISQCEASYALPTPHRPPHKPEPERPHQPAAAPAKVIGDPASPCPLGVKNCLRR